QRRPTLTTNLLRLRVPLSRNSNRRCIRALRNGWRPIHDSKPTRKGLPRLNFCTTKQYERLGAKATMPTTTDWNNCCSLQHATENIYLKPNRNHRLITVRLERKHPRLAPQRLRLDSQCSHLLRHRLGRPIR